MYFQQFYLNCLAHASYLIGSEGKAVVVDPQRDTAIYIEEAAQRGLQIVAVIETHLHADFVSGHVELAKRTGARVYIGAESGATFEHVPVRNGEELEIGRVRLTFLETPGHTIEGICVLVTDLERGEQPFAILTGDTLFNGDVGRPDLSPRHTPRELAGMLYDSLHSKILTLPDELLVYPAHGAGSLCGKQMGSELVTTLGMQRQTNYALRAKSRDEFIELITAGLPERPDYFSRDAEMNRAGAVPLEELPALRALTPEAVQAEVAGGAIVLDVRPATNFLAAHVPSSVNIGLGGQFASWAGAILGLDSKLILVAEDDAQIEEARTRLARVGIDNLVGYLRRGVIAWEEAGLPLERIPEITAEELAAKRSCETPGPEILDVRNPGEWDSGHIDGARNVPLGQLGRRLSGLDSDCDWVVHCQGGYRSAIAASLLKRAGVQQVTNLIGGINAWKACCLPLNT